MGHPYSSGGPVWEESTEEPKLPRFPNRPKTALPLHETGQIKEPPEVISPTALPAEEHLLVIFKYMHGHDSTRQDQSHIASHPPQQADNLPLPGGPRVEGSGHRPPEHCQNNNSSSSIKETHHNRNIKVTPMQPSNPTYLSWQWVQVRFRLLCVALR